jgi:hypothetical protein
LISQQVIAPLQKFTNQISKKLNQKKEKEKEKGKLWRNCG